ncbi:dual OB domain-containing protein [Thiofilum flexile]|uniref:dual OB domain-containing protein n=1 Tax=Thiofilum flexile TaxID=125627 RepID=UPI0003716F81|nr:hypothetical protein [Thiofilum flexile]
MNQSEIVILANSIKNGQHCVAGKCFGTKSWIRPVSNEQGAELSDNQVKYKNIHGIYTVKPLQRIRMGFSRHVPLSHQPENFLIDGKLWQQNYSIEAAEIKNYLDTPIDLWGTDNRVQYEKIFLGLYNIKQSLYLVQVENIMLYYNNNRRRASFSYNNISYDFAVTDPKFDELYSNDQKLKNILCISLGGEYKEYCYKLVATIF